MNEELKIELSEENARDIKFMNGIICEICDYAVENDIKPSETLRIICENILALLDISDFDGWKGCQKQ